MISLEFHGAYIINSFTFNTSPFSVQCSALLYFKYTACRSYLLGDFLTAFGLLVSWLVFQIKNTNIYIELKNVVTRTRPRRRKKIKDKEKTRRITRV